MAHQRTTSPQSLQQFYERQQTLDANRQSQTDNGLPARYPHWRYMTAIDNPSSHWWEYHPYTNAKPAFITITPVSYGNYEYHIYANGRIAITGHATTLPRAMRDSLSRA